MKIKVKPAVPDDDECGDTMFGFDDTTTMEQKWISGGSGGGQHLYFRWTDATTRLMLELRFERQIQFQERMRQKKEIWAEIASEMKALGDFTISGDACDLKYRNMLQTYKKNRLKEERGQQSFICWEYYDLFKDAMKLNGAMEELVPSLLCDTVCVDDVVSDAPENTSDELLMPMRESKSRRSRMERAVKEDEAQHNESKTRSTRTNKRKRHSSATLPEDDAQEMAPPVENAVQIESITTESTPKDEPVCSPAAKAHPLPKGLNESEMQECRVFGESIGLQLGHIKDAHTRALLQLKMQELVYLAKTGRLTE